MEESDVGIVMGGDHQAVRLRWAMPTGPHHHHRQHQQQPRHQAQARATPRKGGWKMPREKDEWQPFDAKLKASIKEWAKEHGSDRTAESPVDQSERACHSFTHAISTVANATLRRTSARKRRAAIDDDGTLREACKRRAQLARAWRVAGLTREERAARLVDLRTHQHHVSKMLRARQPPHKRLKYAGIEGARKKGDERTFYSRLRAMAGRDNRQPPPASMQRPEAAGGGMTSTAPEAERVGGPLHHRQRCA